MLSEQMELFLCTFIILLLPFAHVAEQLEREIEQEHQGWGRLHVQDRVWEQRHFLDPELS